MSVTGPGTSKSTVHVIMGYTHTHRDTHTHAHTQTHRHTDTHTHTHKK